MTKKIPTWLIVYCIACLAFIVLAFGYISYREATIFPPTRPANLEELATWSEPDLMRLLMYYNCSDAPSGDVPDDLKEFTRFCSIVREHWSKAYRESKFEGAREGADKLKQE